MSIFNFVFNSPPPIATPPSVPSGITPSPTTLVSPTVPSITPAMLTIPQIGFLPPAPTAPPDARSLLQKFLDEGQYDRLPPSMLNKDIYIRAGGRADGTYGPHITDEELFYKTDPEADNTTVQGAWDAASTDGNMDSMAEFVNFMNLLAANTKTDAQFMRCLTSFMNGPLRGKADQDIFKPGMPNYLRDNGTGLRGTVMNLWIRLTGSTNMQHLMGTGWLDDQVRKYYNYDPCSSRYTFKMDYAYLHEYSSGNWNDIVAWYVNANCLKNFLPGGGGRTGYAADLGNALLNFTNPFVDGVPFSGFSPDTYKTLKDAGVLNQLTNKPADKVNATILPWLALTNSFLTDPP